MPQAAHPLYCWPQGVYACRPTGLSPLAPHYNSGIDLLPVSCSVHPRHWSPFGSSTRTRRLRRRGLWRAVGRGCISEGIVHHFLPTVCGPDLNHRASPSYQGGQEMKFSLVLRVEKLDFVTILTVSAVEDLAFAPSTSPRLSVWRSAASSGCHI